MGAGIRLIIKTRQSNAEKNNNGCEETENVKAPAQLSPVSLFIMGAAFCMVELTSAFPYFGFLALLTSYHLIFPLALLFMLIYNFMYMLPLILLYFGYNKLQGTTTIKKLESVLDKVSSYIVPVVVSLVGDVPCSEHRAHGAGTGKQCFSGIQHCPEAQLQPVQAGLPAGAGLNVLSAAGR